MMKVMITGDHAGNGIRNEVKKLLDELAIEYEDTGCSRKRRYIRWRWHVS
ncbi:hypothetical protein [Lentibacillus salicampi]